MKKRSTIGWLAEFAGKKKSLYAASVILAAVGVVCSVVPYVLMSNMVTNLIDGNRDCATS